MVLNHPELKAAGVTVGLLFAHGPRNKDGDLKGPALKFYGYQVLSKGKVNSLKDRVEGKPDATVLLDGDEWPLLPDAERAAIIDHELTHLTVIRLSGDEFKTDDIGRPKIKFRLFDIVVGGFAETVTRHGENAAAYQQLEAIAHQHGQLLFPFMRAELLDKNGRPTNKLREMAGENGKHKMRQLSGGPRDEFTEQVDKAFVDAGVLAPK